MLDIVDLHISFPDKTGQNEVVHGISLHMDAGERLGLVGESGCGKTVTSLTVAGLIERRKTEVSGQILFDGRDLLRLSREEMRHIQGKEIGMIFQEPMTSLNPLMKVGHQVEETLRIHTDKPPEECRALALEVMGKVGLPDPELTYEKYPHQLSGGQRQRAMIASAFIIDPKLLIADEPTTALDVTVQAQILELLQRISVNRGIGILFISHDLNVVRRLCTRVAVMQEGKIVEVGPTEEIYANPQHPYTQKLIAAIPSRGKRIR